MTDPRDWFRRMPDEELRNAIGASAFFAGLGVLWMTVVLPLVHRARLAALPWTVLWTVVLILAWRERRHRAVQG